MNTIEQGFVVGTEKEVEVSTKKGIVKRGLVSIVGAVFAPIHFGASCVCDLSVAAESRLVHVIDKDISIEEASRNRKIETEMLKHNISEGISRSREAIRNRYDSIFKKDAKVVDVEIKPFAADVSS